MIDINIFKSLELKVEIDNTNDNIILFKKMLNHKGLIVNSTLSLWAGVMKIKYFSLGEILDEKCKFRSNWTTHTLEDTTVMKFYKSCITT